MRFSFGHWARISQKLTPEEFQQLCAGADIIEQDAHGLKVLRLANGGGMLKLFRIKHLISSARIYPYSRQFCRNADRLHVLGVPTINIKQLFHFADSANSAVLYQPLPGQTLRQLANAKQLDEAMLTNLGTFIASLHQRGIYFRSLHLGNIVVTPNGEFGLIDVADMSIYPWKLRCGRRLRNFYHICRLQKDIRQLGLSGWSTVQASYLEHSALSERCFSRLTKGLSQFLALLNLKYPNNNKEQN